ncbi:hypothetical protein AHAS_Ahas06G0152700 [Arachis hypogaea]
MINETSLMHMWRDYVRIWHALLFLHSFRIRTAQLDHTPGFQSNQTTLTVACVLLSSWKVRRKIVNFTNGMSPYNALVHQLISLLENKLKSVRHNASRNKKKEWLIPYCWKCHLWVYAFEGRLCEDMASIAIPAFVQNTHGPARSYARVPKQPNSFDCGMCVIKFMESLTEDRELHKWDEIC